VKFLVFQHAAAEHPGIFRDLLRADCIAWDAVELDEGVPIPPLDGYDALMVFGGPMDVWQEDRHPWLAAEKAAIRRWVRDKREPFLGVCLGHQLLADALGGRVQLMSKPEVGVFDIRLTAAGRLAPLFEGMPPVFPSLQWHSAEVSELPPHAVSSPKMNIALFRRSSWARRPTAFSTTSSRMNGPSPNGARSRSIVVRSKR